MRVGTRGSKLALWQARHVASHLEESAGSGSTTLVTIKTTGDVHTDVPLIQVPGTSFFTKEIETALGRGEIDLAVHSLKDLASRDPEGLAVAAVLPREDPRDALLSRSNVALGELPAGARVGTSSVRRRSLLHLLRPDLVAVDLRGNVPTRVAKLESGEYDAILLAAAGLVRLGLADRISEFLDPGVFVPAAGQGAIAVQIRVGDEATAARVRPLDHAPTRLAISAERAFLAELGAGCQTPVGVHARMEGDSLRICAIVLAGAGEGPPLDGELEGPATLDGELGRRLAGELLARGAGDLLERAQDRVPGGAQ